MAHQITEIDKGFLTGDSTWHNRPEYILVGNRAVNVDEATQVVDFDVDKIPTFVVDVNGNPLESGSFAVVRQAVNPDGSKKTVVLAPSVGARYAATPHRDIFNTLNENVLAAYPVKICGTGTLSGGATWWIQIVAEQYFIRGDQSPNELRLCYTQTYGTTAHTVFVTSTRIVCDNTRRMALAEAAANRMITKHRHTRGAAMKVNADMDAFAQLHLAVESDIEQMETLVAKPLTSVFVGEFLDKFLPEPGEEASTRATNVITKAREDLLNAFERGKDSLEPKAQGSRYALLTAFTDYVDHNSYARSEADRWMDSQGGDRAAMKDEAVDYLLTTV